MRPGRHMNAALEATIVSLLFVMLAVFSIDLPAGDPSAQLAALVASDRMRVAAFNNADVEAEIGLYGDDAIVMLPGMPPVHGRARIRALLAKGMAAAASSGVSVVLDQQPEGRVVGDIGWVSGTYAVRDRSGRVIGRGAYLSVSKRRSGKWAYVRDAWNSDTAIRLGGDADAEAAK